MKLQNKFSDSRFWKDMTLKTYPLASKEISFGNSTIILSGTKELFVNSPYITDGGKMAESISLSKKDLNGITTPILLKYRSPLNISEDINHVLIKDYYTFLLDLSAGKEEVWKKSVKSKTRNQVRKAQKANYIVKFGTLDLLDDFYKVISAAWRDLGTPTHSKEFYKNIILELGISEDYSAEFIVMYVGDRPVSAACLIQDPTAIYHPYAATLKQYNHLSLNNALYWEIICHAIEKGIPFFDLGRSKKDQGTAPYKKSWGAEEVQLYYYYLNKTSHQNEEENKIVQFLIQVWKKLPLKIANFMGTEIYLQSSKMIKDVIKKDVRQVAEIHKNFLPSIISFYSLDFIEKFYFHHLSSNKEQRIFLGYFEEGDLLGFVFGTHQLDLLFDTFLKNNRFYFIKESLKALVKHPIYFVHLFGKVFQRTAETESQSQLVYIAVDQSYSKKGVGKMLLEGFEKEAKKSVDYYELEVEKNNPALGFYQKNNFVTVSELNGILEKKYLLGKHLK